MVRIITDSSADFEPAELEKMNIGCIPIPVTFGEREYRETVDLSKELFYELLEKEEFPHTSQPSPQEFIDVFNSVKKSGDEAVIILLSSALSGMYNSALVTKSMMGCENCYIVDSLSGTGGQRMIVEYAVKLRDEGKSAGEIAEKIEALRKRVVLYACMDTLEYLHKGGRISGTVFRVGSIARIKPIIHLEEDGTIGIPAKAMGMNKGMEFMCRRVEKRMPDEDFPFYVMYTKDRENGEILRDKLKTLGIGVPDERIIPVGAAIGTHIGPKACGLVYIAKEE